jgi:hypothetical protein
MHIQAMVFLATIATPLAVARTFGEVAVLCDNRAKGSGYKNGQLTCCTDPVTVLSLGITTTLPGYCLVTRLIRMLYSRTSQ